MKSISSVAMDNIPSARASARVRFRRLVIVRPQCNKNVQGVMKQPRKKGAGGRDEGGEGEGGGRGEKNRAHGASRAEWESATLYVHGRDNDGRPVIWAAEQRRRASGCLGVCVTASSERLLGHPLVGSRCAAPPASGRSTRMWQGAALSRPVARGHVHATPRTAFPRFCDGESASDAGPNEIAGTCSDRRACLGGGKKYLFR